MKNKDFGFFQQHIEKIALGLGGVVLVGAAVTQFVLGGPNAIELDNKTVAPGEIKDTVVNKANKLEVDLGGESYVEPIDIPSYADAFNGVYDLPIATDQRLSPIEAGGLTASLNTIESPDYPELLLPSPPMATQVVAKSDHAVLANDGSDLYFQIRNMIGNQEPADFPYVSVIAEVSFKDWRDRLSSSSIPLKQRIDPALWEPRMAITAVQLLREEKDPVTGEWGDAQIIQPMPGQYAVLPDENEPLGFEEAKDFEQEILSRQEDIRRTLFPEIKNGPWTPPDSSNRKFTEEEAARQNELEKLIRRLKRQIDNLTGQDTRSTRGASRRSSGYGEDDQYGEFGDDFGGDYGSASSRSRTSRGNSARDERAAKLEERQREREAEKLEGLETQLAEAQAELNKLLGIDEETAVASRSRGGYDDIPYVEDDPYGEGDYGAPSTSRTRTRSRGSDVSDTVKVWAHDLTAKPGRTYRYKLIASVLNPLYRFPRLNPEQYEANFHHASLSPTQEEIDAAPWSPSAEVELDPEHYFFVIGGSKEQKRASVEVWTVYDGLWRKKEFTEYPGDVIGGIADFKDFDHGGDGVPMQAGPILLDVDTVTAPKGSGSTVRALYLDPESGRIGYRLVTEDKNSAKRQQLENEVARQAELADARLSEAN